MQRAPRQFSRGSRVCTKLGESAFYAFAGPEKFFFLLPSTLENQPQSCLRGRFFGAGICSKELVGITCHSRRQSIESIGEAKRDMIDSDGRKFKKSLILIPHFLRFRCKEARKTWRTCPPLVLTSGESFSERGQVFKSMDGNRIESYVSVEYQCNSIAFSFHAPTGPGVGGRLLAAYRSFVGNAMFCWRWRWRWWWKLCSEIWLSAKSTNYSKRRKRVDRWWRRPVLANEVKRIRRQVRMSADMNIQFCSRVLCQESSWAWQVFGFSKTDGILLLWGVLGSSLDNVRYEMKIRLGVDNLENNQGVEIIKKVLYFSNEKKNVLEILHASIFRQISEKSL